MKPSLPWPTDRGLRVAQPTAVAPKSPAGLGGPCTEGAWLTAADGSVAVHSFAQARSLFRRR